MKNITVVMIKEDIDTGIRSSCSKCPIARAVSRMFPDKDISVGPHSLLILDDKDLDCAYSRYEVPVEATDFIKRFDRGVKPEPITFELSFVERVE